MVEFSDCIPALKKTTEKFKKAFRAECARWHFQFNAVGFKGLRAFECALVWDLKMQNF